MFGLGCDRLGRGRRVGACRRIGFVLMAWLVVALGGASSALAGQPGVISDYASNGSSNSPTPGPATSSALNSPSGVAVDSAGDLYIADSGNSLIEKVTPAGDLLVIAGNGSTSSPTPGPATSSALNSPSGVAVDSATA